MVRAYWSVACYVCVCPLDPVTESLHNLMCNDLIVFDTHSSVPIQNCSYVPIYMWNIAQFGSQPDLGPRQTLLNVLMLRQCTAQPWSLSSINKGRSPFCHALSSLSSLLVWVTEWLTHLGNAVYTLSTSLAWLLWIFQWIIRSCAPSSITTIKLLHHVAIQAGMLPLASPHAEFMRSYDL